MSEIVLNLPVFFIHAIVLLGGKRSHEIFAMLLLDLCSLGSRIIDCFAEWKRDISEFFILCLTFTIAFLDHASFNDIQITTRFSWTKGIIKHIEYSSFATTALSPSINKQLFSKIFWRLAVKILWLYYKWHSWWDFRTRKLFTIFHTPIWTLPHREKASLNCTTSSAWPRLERQGLLV